MAAAERTGEDMWRLPLTDRLREQLKSPIADMRNTGDRFGGAITAGLFLKTFAKDTPWVHVDIAGPASLTSDAALAAQGRHRLRGRDDRRVRDASLTHSRRERSSTDRWHRVCACSGVSRGSRMLTRSRFDSRPGGWYDDRVRGLS